ncbi:MAG: hypothetical protein IKJ16_05170 [Agathobacter sp.]|nr:hypothetical protein [Agathobacter sp.]
MSKKNVKLIVLVVIFILSTIVFSMLTNKVNKDSTAMMAEASLPVVQFVYEDQRISELHGYVQEMDMLSMRDGLIPIGKERELAIEVMTYGNKVEHMSYKIRSMDGTRLLVEEENAKMIATQDKAQCKIALPSLFEDNQEYNMEIVLTMDGQKVYYYTRIVRAMDCYTTECLDFALTFHEYTFREDADTFIPTYMDPATGDATNLSYVDLTCTLRQITWADFTGVKLTQPIASFKEINNSYNAITLNYVMTNVNEDKEVEYYNVEEFYRLRYTPTRTYVLNFERRMNQVFREENNFFLGNTGILLGIRDNQVEYLADDSGNCISFVQEGELLSYNRANHSITKVFGFRKAEGIDARENWNQHDIHIIRVDEAGSISFVVSGYMNRGPHEGQVGVAVYHYDGITHTVEEEVFLPSNKSYEVLRAELGELMYVNEQKMLYLIQNNNVYKIDMNSFQVTTLVESTTAKAYTVSESGRYLAWVEPEKIYESQSLHLEDLKLGSTYEVCAEEGTYVLPIAFIDEDFVYGVANIADVKTDALGDLVFPMSKVEILNVVENKQQIIKSYKPNTGKVGNVQIEEKNLYIELVVEENGRYVVAGADTIMNRKSEPANGVNLKKSVTDLKQTQVAINMKEIQKGNAIQIISPKHILLEKDRTVKLESNNEGYFYTYARGKVLLATRDVSEAIRCANENYGVVVDANLKYIFKRARNNSQKEIAGLSVNEADRNANSMVQAVSMMLVKEEAGVSVSELFSAGQTPIQIMESALKDATVLELKGCVLDELLYFMDQGTPVLAKTGANRAILLTGYSANYVTYYDPASKKSDTLSYEAIDNVFAKGGNYFIAYVK